MVNPSVLLVDDELFNLQLLQAYMQDEEYEIVTVENGKEALSLLENSPQRFDAILLDRMMPEMDGLDVLKQIKAHQQLHMIPVIMQTAKNDQQDVLDGLHAGASYYLTKPFDKEHLLAIVRTAIHDYRHYINLQKEAHRTQNTLRLMDKCSFQFRTMTEAKDVISLLASVCENSSRFVLGLSELFINAIEHGNLGITYEEKTNLINSGTWEEEVERRLQLTDNIDKTVTVTFERDDNELLFFIHDEGEGFNWRDYLNITPERAFHNHGRGIAMANMYSFDLLEFRGRGNLAMAMVKLNDKNSN